jgi:hypothetical protein
MLAETLRDMIRFDTFQPFRVRVRKGRSVSVRQKGRAIAMKTQLAVLLNDRLRFIPYSEISGVERIQPSRRRKGR